MNRWKALLATVLILSGLIYCGYLGYREVLYLTSKYQRMCEVSEAQKEVIRSMSVTMNQLRHHNEQYRRLIDRQHIALNIYQRRTYDRKY